MVEQEELSAFEKVAGGVAILAPLVGLLAAGVVAGLLGGCAYKGGKVVEGTDLAVGLNIPCSEGALQLQVLNYLSGFRLGVDQNAVLRVKYLTSETNDYLGVVHTRTFKTIDAEVVPIENGEKTCAK